ncbi:MAG: cation transporter [Clostridia bacterium]|nr:cation transporter [Clostridia bacterium]
MEKQQKNREQIIVHTSIVGIAVNVLLAVFKAIVGFLSNSIAVVLDAVNNLSDALSSVITIIGAKLAGKKPDKRHPLGYGRIEYLSAMLVSGLVLYAGITSLVESVKKIIWPETASYDAVTFIILGGAILGKVFLGRYVSAKGKEVHSDSLIASGKDALFDALVSSSVLLSAVIFLLTKISLEAYVGILIAVLIIRSGVEMMTETLDKILGERTDQEVGAAVKKTVCEEPGVHGAYDLILHSYGPDRQVGSVHVEVDDTLTADVIDGMERNIANRVYQEHGIILAAVGIYSRNTQNNAAAELQSRVIRTVMAHEGVLQMHGFYLNEKEKTMSLDVIIDFDVDDRHEEYNKILSEVQALAPDYQINMAMDIDA